jgi:D-tyrosyl-tRNA(Tyr) deacylase
LRAVVQRCSRARVTADGTVAGEIGAGLVAFVAAGRGDGPEDVAYTADKIAGLRVFPGPDGRMSASVADVGGAVLVVPQFTLYGDARRGRRPDFTAAAPPDQGRPLLDALVSALLRRGLRVATGIFGAHMRVEVDNDGPVTILLDSRRAF